MNKSRISALMLALALSAVSAFSCADETPSTPEPSVSVTEPVTTVPQVPNQYSKDSNKNNTAVGQEIEVNSTVFTLNDVVNIGSPNNDGNEYVYINVTIQNNTDIEYEISSLNNFFVVLPDDTESLIDIRTTMYAINNYPKCVEDTITIPANGEFTGFLAGGFIVPAGTDSFTIGFFPTLDDDKYIENVILSPVNAEDISHDDSVMK